MSKIHTTVTSRNIIKEPQQQNLGGVISKRGESSIASASKSTAATTSTTKADIKTEPEFIKQLKYQNSDEFAIQTWLSDPSTYPIFLVLGAALVVCAGRCIHGFFYCDDVKVDPSRRGSVVRSFDERDLSIKDRIDTITVKSKTGQSFLSRVFAPEKGDAPVYK